jgi:hypothetical protein
MSYPDPITEIAAKIAGVGYMDVDPDMRKRVKEVLIKMSYGAYEAVKSQPQIMGTIITGRMDYHRPPFRSLNPRERGY